MNYVWEDLLQELNLTMPMGASCAVSKSVRIDFVHISSLHNIFFHSCLVKIIFHDFYE